MATSDPEETAGSGWNVEPQESGFVAFWPHAEAPTVGEVVTAFAAWTATEITPDQLESDDDALWTIGIQVPGIDSGLIVWCERSRDLSEADKSQIGPDASKCAWVIRVQTILSSEEAAAEYFMVVGLLSGSLPDIVAVLDVVTGSLHARTRLDREFLAEGSEPVERLLWRLSRYEAMPNTEEGAVLLGTNGLARCGLPELDLMEVPRELSDAGAVLLHTLAGLMLENTAPEPGQTVEIGDGLVVSLRPVDEVQRFLKDETAGSAQWRVQAREHGLGEFALPRAAVCGREPEGAFKSIWTWPRAVIEQIAEGKAVLYMTQQSVRATERRARATWSTFAMAHASLSRSAEASIRALAETGFMIQAAVPGSGTPRIEQSWFQIQKIDHATMTVAVLDKPLTRSDLEPGMTIELPSDEVSDWRVELGETVFEPDDADDLLGAIDAIRESGGIPPGEPR